MGARSLRWSSRKPTCSEASTAECSATGIDTRPKVRWPLHMDRAIRVYLVRARVRAALRAASDRSAAVRLRAAAPACRESAFFDAADRPLRLRARTVARARFREPGRDPRALPLARSRSALRRVFFEAA